METVGADRSEIGKFVNALFLRADAVGYVSLRVFAHQRDVPPIELRPVELNGEGLGPIIAQATGAANRAARHPQRCVFAPPVAVFKRKSSAAENNLSNGLAIVAELDDAPQRAKQLLSRILGVPTVGVASGGTWTDPESGETEDRLHLYWRLAQPTRTMEEHAQLKRANRLVIALTGADPSAVTAVHPLRWPGSVHRKGIPKLCTIADLSAEVELSLADAVQRLEQAAALALETATGAEAARLRLALELKANGHDGHSQEQDYDPVACQQTWPPCASECWPPFGSARAFR